ncbi:hypothetical protein C0J52_00056 [Blattella germanica]|nr:hypothetical protein C0J52_00056 [Blattella germanica]
MLYIFHVDTGKMMAFDMNLALETSTLGPSVKHLKEVIERSCGIPVDKQVLLVSGGDSLDPNMRVCSYSAGTDTNPIFLFSKSTIESQSPPCLSLDFGPDLALKEQVEASHGMNDTYPTIMARVHLAQKFNELAHEQSRWAAVLANLDDITQAFRNRAEMFEQNFNQHLETRVEYEKLLENFQDDVEMLSKIPLIPALLEAGDNKAAGMDVATVSDSKKDCMDANKEEEKAGDGDAEEKVPLTLLEWISAKNQSSVYQMAQSCRRDLEQLDEQVIESLKADVEKILDYAVLTDMKEISGLEKRLCGLEDLMVVTKRIVQEQNDLAASFQSNHNRATNLGDPSIIPDLCASHRHQLIVMLKNHDTLLELRGRCSRAKQELCHNLHVRLKWVMYVENQMCDLGVRLMIYAEKLKKVRRLIDVIQQVHLCPQMYVTAVGEVVRRRTFSQAFLLWASDLACQLLAVYNEEVARRKDFQNQFEGHFLNTLFPGMEDLPPPFATQTPSPFDLALPKLTMGDVEKLQAQLPELRFSVSGPDLENITQFFLVKSVTGTLKTEDKEEVAALEDRLVKVVTEAGLASHLDPTLLQPADGDTPAMGQSPSPISVPTRDQDREFESETDTEEFEKVGQSPVELGAGGEDGQQAPERAQEVGSSPPPSTTPPFTTADFYIDESMPSSYTEAPELIRQLEDTNTLVALLQKLFSSTVLGSFANENLGNTRGEVERLRGKLLACGHASALAVNGLRAELAGMRLLVEQEKTEFGRLQAQLLAALGKRYEAETTRRHEQIQRLTVDHELEMDSLKKGIKVVVDAKDEEIRSLKQTLTNKEDELASLRVDVQEQIRMRQGMESQLLDLQKQCHGLQEQLQSAEVDKQRSLKELNDCLTHSYKTELESLRSRFRLMATASMERSPSDSSLEKIERPDMIELANHEAIISQMREDLETAVSQERSRWEARMEAELKQARLRSEAERQVWFNEAMRRVVDEKEKQMETLRLRESTMLHELERHRETIRQLTESKESASQGGSEMWPLLDRVDALEADKARLQAQLAEEREKMNTSVAVVPESVSSRDVATSPDSAHHIPQEEGDMYGKLTRSTTSLIQQGKISVGSCNEGDPVLVLWDEEHRNYIILQETTTKYFLHSDCLDDGALAHFAIHVRNYLNETFPGRWIGRGSASSPAPFAGLQEVPI